MRIRASDLTKAGWGHTLAHEHADRWPSYSYTTRILNGDFKVSAGDLNAHGGIGPHPGVIVETRVSFYQRRIEGEASPQDNLRPHPAQRPAALGKV